MSNPAVDVIEEAINGSLWDDLNLMVNDCMPIAEAVVAAIRAMTPAQQAELIGGTVESQTFYGLASGEFAFYCPGRGIHDAREHAQCDRYEKTTITRSLGWQPTPSPLDALVAKALPVDPTPTDPVPGAHTGAQPSQETS